MVEAGRMTYLRKYPKPTTLGLVVTSLIVGLTVLLVATQLRLHKTEVYHEEELSRANDAIAVIEGLLQDTKNLERALKLCADGGQIRIWFLKKYNLFSDVKCEKIKHNKK